MVHARFDNLFINPLLMINSAAVRREQTLQECPDNYVCLSQSQSIPSIWQSFAIRILQVADARADILLRLTPARLALAAALFWLLLFGGIAATLWLLRRQPLLEQASGLEALRKDLDTATAAYVLVERQVRDTLAGQQRTADR